MAKNNNRGNLGKREPSPGDPNPAKPKHSRAEAHHEVSPVSTASTLNSATPSSSDAKVALVDPNAHALAQESTKHEEPSDHKNSSIPGPSAVINAKVSDASPSSDANPYESIIAGLKSLARVRDYIKSKEIPDRVPTVNVATLYRNNFPVIRRIMHLAFAPSKNHLMNIALIDPTEFSLHSERVVRSTLLSQSFFIIGSVVYSDLFGGMSSKQICIQPLHFLWPRIAAAIAQVFGIAPNRALMSNGFKRGVSFTSWLKSGDGSASGRAIPVNGKHHGPAIRSRDEPVPVFDCRSKFKLSSYHTSPPCKVDPENGSIVLIIFTLGRYKELSYSVASYNVQVVLRLADPPTETDGQKPDTPLPAYLPYLEPIGVSGRLEGEEEFEIDDNVEDDPTENVY